MKLVRFGDSKKERPGIIDDAGVLRDLSQHVNDIDCKTLDPAVLERLCSLDLSGLPEVSDATRLGPCIGNVGKFICIGLNYHDHARETGNAIPQHPIVFMKANSAINGPDDDVVLPRGSTHSDWEVELGVVIGRHAKYVDEASALDYVAGFCIVNDVSERFYQTKLTGQWTKGKSCDSFGPIGPWLVTSDEVADPQKLQMTLDVNGQRMQNGNTSDMIFTVRQIIAHLSDLMSLHPGDIIGTGTPAGVGSGMKPNPVFLKAGDIMTLSIDGLGVQTQLVVADR